MARVTVEECIKKVPNHFNLVLLAAGRTKSLEAGISPTLPKEDDKELGLESVAGLCFSEQPLCMDEV